MRNENEYWDIVNGKINPDSNSDDNEFIVEYASDLPVDKYANYTKDPLQDDTEDFDICKQTNMDSLSTMFKLEDS